jgi:hypothetical protein
VVFNGPSTRGVGLPMIDAGVVLILSFPSC